MNAVRAAFVSRSALCGPSASISIARHQLFNSATLKRSKPWFFFQTSNLSTLPQSTRNPIKWSGTPTSQPKAWSQHHILVRPVDLSFSARYFHSTRPVGKTLLTTGLIVAVINGSRAVITALPLIWRHRVFNRNPRLYLLFALVPLIGMFVLVGPSLERHPITQRARFMFVDETSELDLSEEALQATLKTHVNRFLPPTHPTFHRVLNVSENFVRVIGPVRDWELFVVDDPFTVNAFVLPAGKIFVFTGLINRVPSDEHLAAIIGHEISHVLSRHSAETVGATLLFNVFFDFIHAILYSMSVNLPMISDLAGRSVNATSQLISNLPYSRMCEAEADAIGIYLMALAGYNPEKAVEVWDMFHNIQLEAAKAEAALIRTQANTTKVEDAKSARVFRQPTEEEMARADAVEELFSDHPSHRHRAAELRERHLAGALRLYKSRATALGALEREIRAEENPEESQLKHMVRTAMNLDSAAVVKQVQPDLDIVNKAMYKVLVSHIVDDGPYWTKSGQ